MQTCINRKRDAWFIYWVEFFYSNCLHVSMTLIPKHLSLTGNSNNININIDGTVLIIHVL